MNHDEALGLPKGSVRAILTIMLTGALIGAVLAGEADAAEKLGPLAGAGLAMYFLKG